MNPLHSPEYLMSTSARVLDEDRGNPVYMLKMNDHVFVMQPGDAESIAEGIVDVLEKELA